MNDKWMATEDINDELIQTILNTDVSKYLSEEKKVDLDYNGDIFITNKYGLVTGLTDKLSTITQDYKYWWKGCYNNGKPRIFLDDRGFDLSVNGCVLGVAVPICDNDEFIGIIKANINIDDILLKSVSSYEQIHKALEIVIVRSKGLIIYKKDTIPLTEKVDNKYIDYFKLNENISFEENNNLISIAPINYTVNKQVILFGRSEHSNDHIFGSKGESWYVVSRLDEQEMINRVKEFSNKIMIVEVAILFLVIVVAVYIICRITKPLKELQLGVDRIGNGNFEYRLKNISNNEIGDLSRSFNKMTEKLNSTMIKKTELENEIQKRIIVEEKLNKLSTIDELTSLYNRRAFNDFMRDAISKVNRYEEKFCLIMMDIDKFKDINDNFGHKTGDDILKQFSNLLMNDVRDIDKVARWGGDEFIVILSNSSIEEAIVFAERFKNNLLSTKFLKVKIVKASIGITEMIKYDEIDAVITRADKALYKSKKQGKNQITLE
jgi:diguanylate cyclase (GGDEF)-like protein